MDADLPAPEDFTAARAQLGGRIVRTPVVALEQDAIATQLRPGTRAAIKLELFQHAGSFKARGNLLGVERLDPDARKAGVVAASGGNHAMALAWAAAAGGVGARLVMPRDTDPYRVDYCRRMGAEIDLIDRRTEMFDVMNRIAESEGRVVMHPFNAEHMILGAGTIGLEILEDLPDVDMVVVSVGGGGLIGGIASAIRQKRPQCRVIGVEPFGADSLYRSLEAGEPVRLETVSTIADSLASPLALPYSFAIAQQTVDAVVRISDDAMRETTVLMRDALKIVAEPACAAALAALLGPLAERSEGKSVCVIACGSNIGQERYLSILDGS